MLMTLHTAGSVSSRRLGATRRALLCLAASLALLGAMTRDASAQDVAPEEAAPVEVAPAEEVAPEVEEAVAPPDVPVCALSMTGTVLDDAQRPVPKLQLLIVYKDEAGEEDFYEAEVRADGAYSSPALCAGTYWLEASAPGFRWQRVEVTLGESGVYSLVMRRDKAPDPAAVSTRTKAPEHELGAQIGEALDGRALDQRRGESLAETVKGVGGVRAIETGTVSKPMIHGLHSNRLPIIVDGFRHEAQSWGLDHAPEVDPFGAQRIIVLKGSAGVRYGADGIGGALIVEPAPLPRTPGMDGSVFLVGATNGRQGTLGLALRGGIPGTEGWGWRVHGSAKKAGALTTPDYVLDNTGAEELNGSVSAGYRDTRRGFRLTFGQFHNKLGVFTGLVSENANQFKESLELEQPRGVERFRFDYDIERPRQQVDHTTIAAHSFLTTGLGRLSLNMAYQKNKRLEFDLVRSDITGPQLDFDLRTFDAELLLDTAGERWLTEVGATFKYQENRFVGRRLIPNYRAYAGSGFGMFHYLFERAEIEIGARADLVSNETFQREAVGGDAAPITTEAFSFFTPSLVAGAQWSPSDELVLKLGLARTTRYPTINELFIDGVSQGLAAFERGDKALSSERGYAATLDGTWRRGWLEVSATGYAKRINDYIYLAPELDASGELQLRVTSNGGFPSFAYRNIDAQFVGADGQVALTPWTWLSLELRASLIRAEEAGTGQRLVYIPADYYSQVLRLKRRALGPLSEPYIAFTHAYTARQSRVDLRADFAPPPDGYSLLGASTGAVLYTGEGGDTLTLDVEIKNALDTRYRSYLSRQRYFSDEPGRNVIVRLKGSF
jgi:iron complex outermembrane recepter protein